jgi:hypothetical protein
MVNSVFSSSAIYYTWTLKLHKGVIDQLDKYRRHCLSRGSDLNSKKPAKVALPLVCTPKQQGGLGFTYSQWGYATKIPSQILYLGQHSMGQASVGQIL